jgi:O-antigen/teichoic acid export membrane protein
MMGATLVAGIATAALATLQVWRIEGADGPVTRADWRTILTVSLPQALETTLFRMLGWTDVLLLGLLASRAEVGQYKVAFSLAAVCQLPLGALATAYNPEIARGLARRDGVEVQALVGAALRGMVLGVAPLAALLVIFAGPLLALFGEPYRAGIEPLWVLVGAQIASALAVPLLRLIPMSGRFGLNVAEHAVAVVLNAVLNVLLVPRLGALGAAVALAITWSTWALVGLVQARILFGIRLRSA